MNTVRINSATADEIAKLYGIGTELAKRIVQYRNAQGYFHTPEDLAKVPGISLELSLTLSPHIKWDVTAEQPKSERSYVGFVVVLTLLFLLSYSIYDLRIPNLLNSIDLYYQGIHGSFLGILTEACLTLASILGCIAAIPFSLSFVVTAKKFEQRMTRVLFFLTVFMLLDVVLLVIFNAIYYQYYSPKGWAPFFSNEINLTSSIGALGFALFVCVGILISWKPMLLTKNILKWIIDLSILLFGIAAALTAWSGSRFFPIWMLLLDLLFGILIIATGWSSIRTGHSAFDEINEILLPYILNKDEGFSDSWQSWINLRLPNPDDQQALRDALIRTYPPSKARSIFSILFIGIGSWLTITVLASVVDWFVQGFLNSRWLWSIP